MYLHHIKICQVYKCISRTNKLVYAHMNRFGIRCGGDGKIISNPFYNKYYGKLYFFVPKRFQFSNGDKPSLNYRELYKNKWPNFTVDYSGRQGYYYIQGISSTAMFEYISYQDAPFTSFYHSLFVMTTIEHIYKLVAKLSIEKIVSSIHKNINNQQNKTFTVEEFQDMLRA